MFGTVLNTSMAAVFAPSVRAVEPRSTTFDIYVWSANGMKVAQKNKMVQKKVFLEVSQNCIYGNLEQSEIPE